MTVLANRRALQPQTREAHETRSHPRATLWRMNLSSGVNLSSTRMNALLLDAFRPFHSSSHSASAASVTLKCVWSDPPLLHIPPTIMAGTKHRTITGTVGRIVGSRAGS